MYTRCAVVMLGSTSYFSQFKLSAAPRARTRSSASRKSPPPPVKPKPPRSLAFGVAIRPADRPARSEGNLVIGFDHESLALLMSSAGPRRAFLPWWPCPGWESRPFFSSPAWVGICVNPSESLARTFSVFTGLAGRGRCSPGLRPWHRRRRPRPSLRHCCWARPRRRAQWCPQSRHAARATTRGCGPSGRVRKNLSVCCPCVSRG